MFCNPICHWSSANQALLDFNPYEINPDIQLFPADNSELAAIGMPSAVSIYLAEDTVVSGVMADEIGGKTLTVGGTALQYRRAKGFWNGSNFHSKKCIEFERNGITSNAVAANAGVFDYDAATSFGFIIIYRSYAGFLSQYIGKKTTTATQGWELAENAAGFPQFAVEDAGGLLLTSSVGGFDVRDAMAWNIACGVVNRTAGFQQLYSAVGDGARNNIAALGSLSSTEIFRLGSGQRHSAGAQIAYFAMFEGAAAEDLDANFKSIYLPLLYTRACDRSPSEIRTPITYSFASGAVGSILGRDDEGIYYTDWDGDNTTSAMPFVWSYDENFTHPSKLGLLCHDNASIEIEYTDYFAGANWTRTNCTIDSAWSGWEDAPSGMKMANVMVATANNAWLTNTISCAAGELWSFRIFVRRSTGMGSNVTGRLVAYDRIGTAEIASIAFTATAVWEQVNLQFTTPVGCTSMDFVVEIDNNGEELTLSRFSAYQGPMRGPTYRIGSGAATSLAWSIQAIAGTHMKGNQGEIEAKYICFSDLSDISRYIVAASPANNRRLGRVNTAGSDRFSYYNSAGGFVGSDDSAVYTQNQEHVVRLRWDLSNPLPCGQYTEIIVDGVSVGGAAVSFGPGTDTTTEIHLGQNYTYLEHLCGTLAYLKIYENPQ